MRCPQDGWRLVADRRGQRVAEGRFVIESLLGVGGAGSSAWVAREPLRHRKVALKLLLASEVADEQRFERGAILAASLVHPNIAPVYDHGRDGALLWAQAWAGSSHLRAVAPNGDAIAMGGVLRSPIDFGGGVLEPEGDALGAWYAELGADGAHRRSLVLPSSQRAIVEEIRFGPAGERLIRGTFWRDFTLAGSRVAETIEPTVLRRLVEALDARRETAC